MSLVSKLNRFLSIIKQNGGWKKSVVAFFVRDELKDGTFVGEDIYGNKYYENNYYFFGRNRWVHYADHVYLDYDASQVPAEWFGWLHYRTDLKPCEDPSRPNYPWMLRHTANATGTKCAYYPYSTTLPSVTPWVPPKCPPKCKE